jgi:PIN domain nuclease of toxin-antitoxin system
VIVIDTHVLLWWANLPNLLSTAADEAVTNADTVAVSAITAWEIAVLHHRHRIEIDGDSLSWMRDLEERRNLRILPVTIEIAPLAAKLHELCATQWIRSSPPPPSRMASRSSRKTSAFNGVVSSKRSGDYALTSCFANMPGV